MAHGGYHYENPGNPDDDSDDDDRLSIDSDIANFLTTTNEYIGNYLEEGAGSDSRSCWVHAINQNRATFGEHATTYEALRNHPDKFQEYYRLTPYEFDELYALVSPHITGPLEASHGGMPIGGRPDSLKSIETMALTLRWLAHGGTLTMIAHSYKMAISTVHKHVRATLTAINEALHASYMVMPGEYEWQKIADGFSERWNFPNCLGAIDGKHIEIQAPDKSHSMYFNYKKRFSIVLLAITDSAYRFIHVDIGEYGKSSDGGTFSTSKIGAKLRNGDLNIPQEAQLPGTNDTSPYVFVADEAFPLQEHIMRPYGGHAIPLEHQVFNYRLSRLRHVVENSFGILVNRWRILKTRMEVQPDHATDITEACCLLHNFIIDKRSSVTQEADTVRSDGSIEENAPWRRNTVLSGRATSDQAKHLDSVQSKFGTNYPTQAGTAVRQRLVEYFNSESAMLPYQIQQAQKHY